MVYNIQGRTGVNVEPATLKRLAEIDNIVGVKEASGNIGQMATVLHLLPEPFIVLSGDDAITIPLIALGGRGVISVVANEIPAEFSKLTQLALAGDFAGARALQRQWFALMEVNFCEANPGPVKAAMAMMGLLEPVFRLPMVPPSEANRAKIEAVLKSTGLLAAARSYACKVRSKLSSTIRRPLITKIISCCSRVSRRRSIQARCARPSRIRLRKPAGASTRGSRKGSCWDSASAESSTCRWTRLGSRFSIKPPGR